MGGSRMAMCGAVAAALALWAAAAPAQRAAPAATPADGSWSGRSDSGSCGQPLDIRLVVQQGLVDGTGGESGGKAPLLWQYLGRARPDGTIEAVGNASTFPPQQQQQVRLAGRVQGATLAVSETSGCRRSATLSRG